MDNVPFKHVLSLSGGKDSSALAVYMKDRLPEVDYVFMDTGEELDETYEYLGRLEAYLGKRITWLKSKRYGFKDLLEARRGFLPSPQARWCTEYLKIKPFEDYVQDTPVVSYIAIRADEAHRKGYISTKPNISARYPFIEDGLVKEDIERLLEESGLGLPTYYSWRSRSGCYFCFFQQRIEWVNLLETHPQRYWDAASYEREDPETGERYTWNSRESLIELAKPERVAEIKADAERRAKMARPQGDQSLMHVLCDPEDREPCVACHF